MREAKPARPAAKETKGSGERPKKILLVNGPNLNMLGRREEEYYGRFTLEDVVRTSRKAAEEAGFSLLDFQSNHEGDLIDFIHAHLDDASGLLLNAGALSHYSYALLDALKLCPYPVMEVHISAVEKREDFRRTSVIRPACAAVVSGLGIKSYTKALVLLLDILAENNDE